MNTNKKDTPVEIEIPITKRPESLPLTPSKDREPRKKQNLFRLWAYAPWIP